MGDGDRRRQQQRARKRPPPPDGLGGGNSRQVVKRFVQESVREKTPMVDQLCRCLCSANKSVELVNKFVDLWRLLEESKEPEPRKLAQRQYAPLLLYALVCLTRGTTSMQECMNVFEAPREPPGWRSRLAIVNMLIMREGIVGREQVLQQGAAAGPEQLLPRLPVPRPLLSQVAGVLRHLRTRRLATQGDQSNTQVALIALASTALFGTCDDVLDYWAVLGAQSRAAVDARLRTLCENLHGDAELAACVASERAAAGAPAAVMARYEWRVVRSRERLATDYVWLLGLHLDGLHPALRGMLIGVAVRVVVRDAEAERAGAEDAEEEAPGAGGCAERDVALVRAATALEVVACALFGGSTGITCAITEPICRNVRRALPAAAGERDIMLEGLARDAWARLAGGSCSAQAWHTGGLLTALDAAGVMAGALAGLRPAQRELLDRFLRGAADALSSPPPKHSPPSVAALLHEGLAVLTTAAASCGACFGFGDGEASATRSASHMAGLLPPAASIAGLPAPMVRAGAAAAAAAAHAAEAAAAAARALLARRELFEVRLAWARAPPPLQAATRTRAADAFRTLCVEVQCPPFPDTLVTTTAAATWQGGPSSLGVRSDLGAPPALLRWLVPVVVPATSGTGRGVRVTVEWRIAACEGRDACRWARDLCVPLPSKSKFLV